MKLNESTTNHLQLYYSMVEVAGALFGGKKSDSNVKNVNDMTPEEAVEGINALFRMAGGGS